VKKTWFLVILATFWNTQLSLCDNVISLNLERNRNYFILLDKGPLEVYKYFLKNPKGFLENEIRINLKQNIDAHKAKDVTVLYFKKIYYIII
jgi:hypothetical protein